MILMVFAVYFFAYFVEKKIVVSIFFSQNPIFFLKNVIFYLNLQICIAFNTKHSFYINLYWFKCWEPNFLIFKKKIENGVLLWWCKRDHNFAISWWNLMNFFLLSFSHVRLHENTIRSLKIFYFIKVVPIPIKALEYRQQTIAFKK